MAARRHTQCISLLVRREIEISSWTVRLARTGPDPGLAPLLEEKTHREIERAEALERSDRLDRWWQALCRRYGPH